MILLFNNKIPNYDELIKQLKSLKEEAFIQMRSPLHDDIFNKDFYALSIAINIIEEIKNNDRDNGKTYFKTERVIK